METIVLRNEFHHTKYRTRLGMKTYSTRQKIRRTLCGMSDCVCGGELGDRDQKHRTTMIYQGRTQSENKYLIEKV